ncbi:MAG: TetR-like C-terminal domain-containing protein [Oscillospiraceae bacterium]
MEKSIVDSRVRRTKKLLRHGITELMEQKSLNKITVKELSELVEINRGTFYLHYKDIYDLVSQIENELFEEFKQIIFTYELADLETRPYKVFSDVCTFFHKNREICAALLSDNGDLSFMKMFRKILREKCLNELTVLYHITEVDEYRYIYAYFENGAVGIIHYWLETDDGKSPDEIALLIENIFVNGINGFKQNNN